MPPLFVKPRRESARGTALTVAVAFAVAGAAWVLLTDILLYQVTRDAVLVARIETAKGWTFVIFAAALVYFVTLRSAARLLRARAAIAAVVESIADGVLLLAPDRTIARANPAAARMLACDHLVGMGAEEFSRRFRVSHLDGSLVPPSDFISQRVFDEGGRLNYKAVLRSAAGKEIVISATAAAVRADSGESADMVVSVMHDITDSERFERLRDQFFSAAAHTLKTPVAIIKANAQALPGNDVAQAGRLSEAIARQCDRIDLLVRNLLVLGRLRSSSLQLYPREVELRDIVDRAVHEAAAVASGQSIRVASTAEARVRADDERLTLALCNLIDEAVRLSAPEHPVTVRLERYGSDASIAVHHRLMRPDELVCAHYQNEHELGISRLVTSRIVEAHGGSMSAGVAGPESTMSVRLPTVGHGA